MLRDIEETAKRDMDNLREEYDKRITELENKETNNKTLREQINSLKVLHDEEVNRIKRFYETSANEQQKEIQQLLMEHKLETQEFQKAYQNIERNNRDLLFNYENEKSRARGLEEQLQRLNSEKYALEKNMTDEIQRLKYELDEQRKNFSQIREQEINNLNQSINQLTSQKQQIEAQYNQLSQEYQTLLQSMNTLSADQSQYLNALQSKEKQNQDDRKLYETVYNKAIAEKDNIQKEAFEIISQKDQLIQQLTNEIDQVKLQQQQQQIIAKPEEVKLDIKPEQPRINAEKYHNTRISQSRNKIAWTCRTRRIYRNSNV